MAQTPRIVDIEKIVHGNKVKTDFIAAPHTQIVNEQGEPRKIPDLANNLKASVGVERVTIKSAHYLDRETGLNGQRVLEPANKDQRVRFVGDWYNLSDTNGSRVNNNGNNDDFVEITFYGTGLNALAFPNLLINAVYSVDGGAESAIGTTPSTVITGRNYESNTLIPIVSGLSLGIHTVKIRASIGAVAIYGFEILNESTQLTINKGQPFVGGKAQSLSSQNILDIKPLELSGTKGGRVIIYIDSDGKVQRAITEVNATSQFLNSSSHANEEVVRRVHYREFGRNRGDDYNSMSGFANRAFTLDDGTTTLVGQDVSEIAGAVTGDFVLFTDDGASNFYTLTFVGTGLDLERENQDANVRDDQVFVDGIDVGSISLAANEAKVQKICSGLPYGTHTVKIKNNNGALNGGHVKNFIIYGPKKPELPENVVEITDYNVMADFVANSTVDINYISQGVLRKQNTREAIYSGTITSPALAVDTHTSGFYIGVQSSSSVKYTFFGTGFDLRSENWSGGTANTVVSLNGNTLTAANFPTANFSVYGTGTTFNDSTGVLDFNDASTQYGTGFVVQDLPLGLYTVEFAVGTNTLAFDSLDIITPIHINNPDLKTGNLSLKDLRSDPQIQGSAKKKVDMTVAKAWLVYDDQNNRILSSFNIASVLDTGTGNFRVYLKQPFKDDNYVILFGGNVDRMEISDGTRYKDSVNIITKNTSDAAADQYYNTMAFFGELEDEENINLEDL